MILSALKNQYRDDFEVVIADDGSRDEIVEQINALIPEYPFQIQHAWHEDSGFRKNRILNQALLQASYDYLIFIDGDCIPQDNFVHDHLAHAAPNTCLNGRRADLSPSVSQTIREDDNTPPNQLFKTYWKAILTDYVRGHGKNIEKGLRIVNPTLSQYLNKKDKGLVGCNFSLFKSSLLKINGFDERYESPGVGEDSDIEYRLRLDGVKIKNIFYLANQIHLYHTIRFRDSINQDIFLEVQRQQMKITPYGIEKA
ncbi:glycosyltransferase [Photobacterium sp. TY1-4]|nr:glycosyltransferase [Photobacterium sp. TY1-4]